MYMRVSICKEPLFFCCVVFLYQNTKTQEGGIPHSSPSCVLERRVFIAGCCHCHSTFRSLRSHIRLRPAYQSLQILALAREIWNKAISPLFISAVALLNDLSGIADRSLLMTPSTRSVRHDFWWWPV